MRRGRAPDQASISPGREGSRGTFPGARGNWIESDFGVWVVRSAPPGRRDLSGSFSRDFASFRPKLLSSPPSGRGCSGCHTEPVFTIRRPADAEIERCIVAARAFALPASSLLSLEKSPANWKRPAGFAHDHLDSCLGIGEGVFAAAKRAFAEWTQFDLGWARVANPAAAVGVGEIVAVEVRSLGLWSLNLSRIVETVDDTDRFGFVYSTTEMHVEQGDERFLLRWDRETGEVWYELEAVSRERNSLARLGRPVTRGFQRRFARDSHRRMLEVIGSL
jgi:uncharacterized protein (UPF0548 family)